MGLFPSRQEQRSAHSPLDDFWYKVFPNIDTASGVKVSESTMLESSAVFACINVISQDIGQLPAHLYKRIDEKGKERAVTHSLYNILRYSPCPEMTAMSFKETLQSHILTWGNAYANVDRDKQGRIKALWILSPSKMEIVRDGTRLLYIYTLPSGEKRKLTKDEIFHIPGLSFNGITGYSPITLMRESLALSMAEQEYHARFFGNGAMATQIMTHPGHVSDKGKQNIRAGWDKMHKGLSNAHRMAILEEGVDIKQIGLTHADSQFLEGREFQINELARFFRMPLHKIQKMNDTSYNNIENMSLEYVTGTLMPWATKWEQAVHLFLLGRNEKSQYFVEFMFQQMLRGNAEARAKFYQSMWSTGSLSPDDIRAMENLNPIANGDGDQYFVPLNFIPIDKAGEAINPIKDTGANNTIDNSDSNDDSDDSNDDTKSISYKELRSVKIRNRYRTAYIHLFNDVGDALVKKETSYIKRAIKKHGNTDKFIIDIEKFYDGEMRKFIQRRFGAVISTYHSTLAPEIYDELGIDSETDPIDGIETFTQSYIDKYYNRHVSSSLGQINYLLHPSDKKSIRTDLYEEHRVDADDDVDEEDNELAALDTRMDEWNEKRGGKIAVAEIVRAEGAIVTYMTLSVERSLIWQIQGKNTCEACQSLAGQIIQKDQWFVEQGDDVDNGDKNSIHVSYSRKHPPLHYGCDCMVLPG